MLVFQSQAAAQALPQKNQQNAAYDVIFLALEKTKLADAAIKAANAKFGLTGSSAASYAEEAKVSASTIMDRIIAKYGLSSGRKINAKTAQEMANEFKVKFAEDRFLKEGIFAALQRGEVKDLFSFIGTTITSSKIAHQECQDQKKVDVVLKNYGLSDSALRNFFEQLPGMYALYLSKGAPASPSEIAMYYKGVLSQSEDQNRFMQSTEAELKGREPKT